MNQIKLMAVAGFAYPSNKINCRQFVAAPGHATINGTNYTLEVIDPALPASCDIEVVYQFGTPKTSRLEYTPGKGWDRADRPGHNIRADRSQVTFS